MNTPRIIYYIYILQIHEYTSHYILYIYPSDPQVHLTIYTTYISLGSTCTPHIIYRVVLLTGPPINFLSTGSHANWPRISLKCQHSCQQSWRDFVLRKFRGGDQLKEPPCTIYISLGSTCTPHIIHYIYIPQIHVYTSHYTLYIYPSDP